MRVYWRGYGSDDGPQGFELSALGGTVLASEESRALVYIDRSPGPWHRSVEDEA